MYRYACGDKGFRAENRTKTPLLPMSKVNGRRQNLSPEFDRDTEQTPTSDGFQTFAVDVYIDDGDDNEVLKIFRGDGCSSVAMVVDSGMTRCDKETVLCF